MQTAWVVQQLQAVNPGLQIETIYLTSSGDKIQDRPLYEFGGKGLFTRELEVALLEQRIDLAVHSFKDVPVTMPLVEQANLEMVAVPPREDVRDVLVSVKARSIDELPQGAKVGTGSLRRRCQILERRPDLQLEPVRGNIDTRIRKLREGQYDGIILAMAGLKRSNLFDPQFMFPIDTAWLLPAAGQGALALQCRRDDAAARQAARPLNDDLSFAGVAAERELVLALNGDCHSPIAALAAIDGDTLTLAGALGAADGAPPVKRSRVQGPRAEARPLARRLADALQ
jgi:hydroxymethylbilane synthase